MTCFSVIMSAPKTIYEDAQNNLDLTMRFEHKKNSLLEYQHGEKSFIATMLKGHLTEITIRHNA